MSKISEELMKVCVDLANEIGNNQPAYYAMGDEFEEADKENAVLIAEAILAEREKTIRECVSIAGQLAEYHGLDIGDAGAMGCEEVQHAILALLEQKR